MDVGTLLAILCTLVLVIPLAWKWQLGVRRVALFVAFTGGAFGAALSLLGLRLPPWIAGTFVAAATLLASFAVLAYRFYRDPERAIPQVEGAILSPADGTVVYLKHSGTDQLPIATKHRHHCPVSELLKTSFYSSEACVIGISMSLLDVHVNRAPIAGRVVFQRHFPGKFGSLRLPERVLDNERVTTIIQAEDLQIAIVQIASRLVRRILSYVNVGECVSLGQRFGAIRLGSQVDLVLPMSDDLRIQVQHGDRVRAGETVLATYNLRRHGTRVPNAQRPLSALR